MMTKIDKLVFDFIIIVIIILYWIVLRRFYNNPQAVIYIIYWKNWFKECNKYIDISIFLLLPTGKREEKIVSSQRKPAQETHGI